MPIAQKASLPANAMARPILDVKKNVEWPETLDGIDVPNLARLERVEDQ
jgi:hypothetical protein